MKKALAIILTALLIVSSFTIVVIGATETANITVGEDSYYVNTGDSIAYIVNLKTTTPVINGQFTMNYPGDILEITTVNFPIISNVMYNYKDKLVNQLKFNFSYLGGYSFDSNNAVLVEVLFRVKLGGVGRITLDKEVLSSMSGVGIIETSEFSEKIIGVQTEPTTEAPTQAPTTAPVTEAPTQATEPPTQTPKPTCNHSKTVTIDAKKATYFAKGYTGDKICIHCDKKVSSGKAINKLALKTPKVTVKPAKKAITVKYRKVTGAKGFVVSYKIGKKTYTKNFKATKSKTVRISRLKKGKKYTVSVRAYTTSGSKKAYSSWTKPKKVKVK